MNNSTSTGHPLTISVENASLVSDTIPMLDFTLYQICYSLYTSVGMPWKSLHIVFRILGVKGIQHQEGIKFLGFSSGKYPRQIYPCPIYRSSSLYNLRNLSILLQSNPLLC